MEIREVNRNNRNRYLFRQIARDSSGEVYEAPEGSRLFFAYKQHFGEKKVVGVASFTPASASPSELPEDSVPFINDYYHHLSYLFVLAFYKGQGIGTLLLKDMEVAMASHIIRPIHVESAGKAVRFFEKHGYSIAGDIIECCCPGSKLFRRIQHMQKDLR